MERTKFKNKGKEPPDGGNPYLTKELFNKLFKKYGGDPVAVYALYSHTAVWQNTDQPKATDTYCIKALKWGSAKFYKNKELLKKLKLIKQIEHRNENGRVDGWYIRVNHYVHQNPQNRGVVHTRSKSPERSVSETGSEESNTKEKLKNRNAQLGDLKSPSNIDTTYKAVPKERFTCPKQNGDKEFECDRCNPNAHRKFIVDDGMKYYVCSDGRYRNKSGARYIQ